MSDTVHDFTTEALDWRPYVTPVDIETATPAQREALQMTPSNRGISAYVLVLANEPEMLRERTPLFNDIMYSDGGLSRGGRELGVARAGHPHRERDAQRDVDARADVAHHVIDRRTLRHGVRLERRERHHRDRHPQHADAEALQRHSRDHCVTSAHHYRLSHDVRGRAQVRGPEGVRDRHRERRMHPIVGRMEQPAQMGLCPNHLKVVAGDEQAWDVHGGPSVDSVDAHGEETGALGRNRREAR